MAWFSDGTGKAVANGSAALRGIPGQGQRLLAALERIQRRFAQSTGGGQTAPGYIGDQRPKCTPTRPVVVPLAVELATPPDTYTFSATRPVTAPEKPCSP